MTPTDIEDFFAPFAQVTARRMFSGHGVYVGTACFALVAKGSIWIKADPATEKALESAGSSPFSMVAPDGAVKTMRAFWSLPDAALDDPDELKRWCGPALAAAQVSAAAKADKLRRLRAQAGNEAPE